MDVMFEKFEGLMGKRNICVLMQGINIILTANEHRIGRMVQDPQFQIEATSVSANHCRICRKKVADSSAVFLKDTRLCF